MPLQDLVQQAQMADQLAMMQRSKIDDLGNALLVACYAQAFGFELAKATIKAQEEGTPDKIVVNTGAALHIAKQAAQDAMIGLGMVKRGPPPNKSPIVAGGQ